MPRPFRFAVQQMALTDRDTVVAAARQAEDLGFDELYSHDHLGSIDPFIPLIVAAEATERLRVGPLVLNNEFHHPALLARTVATADRLTGGRVVLGIGTGYAQAEHDAMALPLRAPKERVERFEGSVRALRSLLDSGAVEMEDAHHTLAVSDLGVRPGQDHVPLLIGGHGRQVVRIAGQLADIFQFTGLTFGPDGAPDLAGFAFEQVARRARWLDEASGDREIERSVLVQRVVIGDDVDEVIQKTSQELGLPSETVEATPFLLFGSVARIVEKLHRLREELGISHVVIRKAAEFAPVVAALT